MKLADKLLKVLEVEKIDLDFIADQLHNDDESSDDEMINFISLEAKVNKAKVKELIKKERSNFLGIKYSKNSKEDDNKIIMKYLGK